MQQTNKRIGRQLAHQPSRHPVVGILQSPLYRNHLTDPFLIRVTGFPKPSVLIGQALLHVQHLVTRIDTFNHCKGIEVRFNSGTDLATASIHHIILEIIIIDTTHIGFHMTGARIHRHEAGTQETLMIADRIQRRHRRVYSTSPTEHTHLDRFVKGSLYLFLTRSRLLHGTVPICLVHSMHKDRINLALT